MTASTRSVVHLEREGTDDDHVSLAVTEAALVESAERHFGGLDKFDSTRWPGFTTQGGGR